MTCRIPIAARVRGGKTTEKIHRKNKTGIYGQNPNRHRLTDDDCIQGGKTRGDLHAINKTGVCGRSKIKRLADAKLGGHTSQHINKGILKPECELCLEILSREAAQE
jgi:hypothetical protein